MTDELLSELRQAPRPAFAEALKQRLDAIEVEQEHRRPARSGWLRLRPALAGVTALGLVATALSVPAVRASARGFLEIFRVKRFAAVPVDVSRLERLRVQKLDLRTLVGDQLEVLVDPGEPQSVPDIETAEGLAGLQAALPSSLPPGWSLAEVRVAGQASFRATLDAGKIEELARALGVEDLPIPEDVDGATVTVETSPAVMVRYARGKDEIRYSQARSPEVTLPEGLHIRRLGALGLRLAGMSPEESELFAGKLDWRTTLLVPVPAAGGDFRDVAVGDGQGLLVTVRPPRRAKVEGQPGPRRWHSILLWSKGDRVFALEGPGHGVELLQLADAIS